MQAQVRTDDAQGRCLARDNLVIAFFGSRPFAEMAEGVANCVDMYFAMLPEACLQWSIIGASAGTHKPLTPKDVARCRAMLTAGTAKQKDIHFRLMGPDRYGPDYQLVVDGNKLPSKEGFLNETNAVEMRFPRQFLDDLGADAIATAALQMFNEVPCDSGYASIALCYGQDDAYDKAREVIAPTAFRSHGYDVPNTLYTATALGDRSRGARWLTMLGTGMVQRLGGATALAARLAKGVTIFESAQGLMLRAGDSPEIGDVNRQQSTPLLTSVAAAIEPVSFFGDKGLGSLLGGPDARNRWERRFWPDA